jgi:hypothetical protein
MKKVIFALLVSFITLNQLVAQPVSKHQAEQAVLAFLFTKQMANTPTLIDSISGSKALLARIYSLKPGFVIVAVHKQLNAVLAYSFTADYDLNQKPWPELLPILKADYEQRLMFASSNPVVAFKNKASWEALLQPTKPAREFQQWPPEGSTPTGGWLFTNWTQSAPYNKLCPMDNTTGQRSYVGCPATAMAQILNLHRRLNHTRFTDADDYFHNYGGNQFWFDDDYATFKFPSWPKLNQLLDTLETYYDIGKPTTDSLNAALSLACGLAANQVYSSSGSGTWGVEQAQMAYQRFDFTESVLVYNTDTTLNQHLAENIKLGMPAHLALVDPGVTVGHNIVVDGYNTDEFFHFNFGWGGSANGWYTMPPSGMPYNLMVIEGIVLDIDLGNHTTGIGPIKTKQPTSIWIYTQANEVHVEVAADLGRFQSFEIFSTQGQLLQTGILQNIAKGHYVLKNNLQAPGIYLLRIATQNAEKACGKFVF